jgi:hypothetical protein
MNDSRQPSPFEAAATLLRRVRELRAAQAPQRRRRIKTLLGHAQDIVAELQARSRASASRTNVFNVLDIGDCELSHSRFLAFLLNPAEQHDQRTLFLQSFLARFSPGIKLSAGELADAFVRREFTAESDRPDIVIFLPDFSVVCIENKTGSGEGRQQIARYQDWLRSLPPGRKQLIFLTPTGRDPITAKSCAIPVTAVSYRAIAEWLQSSELMVPGRLRAMLDMHAEACLQLHRLKYRSLNEIAEG